VSGPCRVRVVEFSYKRIKTVPCPTIRPSVCLSVPGQRARQQQSRAEADDAHRWLRMTRGPRKFWSDCKEVQRTLL